MDFTATPNKNRGASSVTPKLACFTFLTCKVHGLKNMFFPVSFSRKVVEMCFCVVNML